MWVECVYIDAGECFFFFFFFFNDTATTEIYTLSLHDALPILKVFGLLQNTILKQSKNRIIFFLSFYKFFVNRTMRSEEHTSELQSHSFISYAVFCLKKKKNNIKSPT